MLSRSLTPLFLLLGLALAFCATGLHAERDRAWPTSDGPQPIDASAGFHIPDVQLGRLIQDLLEHNPEVQATREISFSRLARAPQERSLPDPQFSYRYFVETPETRVGPQDQRLEISQTVPWFGKRELQGERAEHLASGTSWHGRDLERTLVADLKRAYFDAAYLQEALAINRDEADFLRRFERIALVRYSTGEGIQQSVIKVQTDISRLADQEIALRERLDVARRHIAALLGHPAAEVELDPITLSLPDVRLDGRALEAEATRQNPRVFATQQQIEADRAWVQRRQRDAYPDFSFGLGYTDVGRREDLAGIVAPPEDNGKDIWALTVKMNIPLYRGRIRAGVAEAEHSLSANRRALQQTQNRVQSGVQQSVLRLQALGERAGLYRDLLVPQAEESLASAEAAYTTNRQGFLDLLDAERVLFQVRLTYHRLVADYWSSLADLEREIARPFPADPAPESPSPEGSPTQEGSP